jgi:uncharacterized protein (DUF608 family)
MNKFIYKDEKANKISFPLGGIGSGSIGLAGNGRFVDVEIANRPNKGSHSGYTHFAVKVEDDEKVIDARVINSDREPDYIGNLERPTFQGFGFGPDRADMTGFPHFKKSEFTGEFPIAKIDFFEEKFPGKLSMTAFNPFIPTNDKDSSIPSGFFEFEITNTQDKELTYSIGLSCNNYYANKSKANSIHSLVEIGGRKLLHLSSDGNKKSTEYGDLAITSDAQEVSYQCYWFRGNWFDNLATYWQDFKKFGKLKDRNYDHRKVILDLSSADDIATLVAHTKVKAGESKKVRFVLSWSMPLMSNYWSISAVGLSEKDIEEIRNKTWKNYYATIFESSIESAFYGIENFSRLLTDTAKFKELLFKSSLPQEALDAISANMSILKTPTCLRLTDGSFYAFEGVMPHEGSCEGTCNHVWSYTYAMAFLFPKLERSARSIEYNYSLQDSGGLAFRVQMPIGMKASDFRPCVDGQYGTVMRVYREFLISGDLEWLKSIWKKVKRTIEYAWSAENYDQWDRNKDGILKGRQHHTLDMELFGANSWLSGMYLGGLKAGAELARILGEEDTYEAYMKIFNKGVKKLNEELFNGEYFIQSVDLSDQSQLLKYTELSVHGQSVLDAYWNEEQAEMKYQIGDGCSIDQVLGQWHADLIGIGKIFEDDKVEAALKSIYKYNFIDDMHEHYNPCRIYCLNDESGTIICAYPEHKHRPFISVPYAEETMHGFEYQAASHMIKRGLTKEGLRCVKAVRDRYDGKRRNPWNEFECGSNYARSMASYALLLAYSGFKYNAHEQMIGFEPIQVLDNEVSSYFWSLDSGWGEVEIGKEQVTLKVAYGTLNVVRIILPFLSGKNIKSISMNNTEMNASIQDGIIDLTSSVILYKDCELIIQHE